MNPSVCLIYSTHPSLEQARLTAAALLDAQLAACCNILPGMESHFVWHGQREHTTEYAMLTKTTAAAAATVRDRIRTLHPYDCPAVVEIPVEAGNPDFLAWIETMVKTTR